MVKLYAVDPTLRQLGIAVLVVFERGIAFRAPGVGHTRRSLSGQTIVGPSAKPPGMAAAQTE
jgi:hypothetical protein